VQSSKAQACPQVKEFLESSRTVLFPEVPARLLACIDIACHGVPSPLVCKAYVATMQERGAARITSAGFWDKTNGWRNFSMKLELENIKHLIIAKEQDAYLKAFMANYDLRPSSYKCVLKKRNSGTDIALADSWGIEHVLPEMDDDKGGL